MFATGCLNIFMKLALKVGKHQVVTPCETRLPLHFLFAYPFIAKKF